MVDDCVEGCRLGTQNGEIYLGRTANDQVGNIYVGRTLNVSRAVGSELKMANFTLVERRMTKVKSHFGSLGIQNDEFYFGRSANDQSKIAFLAAARQVKFPLVAHMRQTTTQINSTFTIWPSRPESSIHSSFDGSKLLESAVLPALPFAYPPNPPIAYASLRRSTSSSSAKAEGAFGHPHMKSADPRSEC